MRHLISSALVTIMLGAATPALPAQANGSVTPLATSKRMIRTEPDEPAATCCNSRLTPAEEARIARQLAEADALIVAGRMTEARSLLRGVIDDQTRGKAYPATAMRRLADVEFALDRPVVAAGVLVALADAASEVADPKTELQALVDAVIVYGQSARRAEARELRPRIRRLLDSPAISEEMRRSLARTLTPE